MRRREFIAAIGGAVAWPLAVRAQQPMPVIGFLNAAVAAGFQGPLSAFLKGLGETGYTDGQTLRSSTAGQRVTLINCPPWRPV